MRLNAVELSRCNSNQPSANKNESGTHSATLKGESASSKQTNLTWFAKVSGWNPPSPWNTDPNSVEGPFTSKVGVTFKFNIPAQDASTKLSLMLISSAKLPDIMTLTNGTLEKK